MRNIGAVILAAGGSVRFGAPKQFVQWGGESLLQRSVRAAREGGCCSIVAVCGDAAERCDTELAGYGAVVSHNPDWSRGIGTSIRCGLQRLLERDEQVDAVILLLCDQPFVNAASVAVLVRKWGESGCAVVASRYANTLGVPALFAATCFPTLLKLPDDSGAKPVIQAHGDKIAVVEFAAGAFDIDTPDDLARAQAARVQ